MVGADAHGTSVLFALQDKRCEQLLNLHHILVIFLLRNQKVRKPNFEAGDGVK